MSVRRLALLSCSAFAVACTATETGNPVAPQELSLTARSTSEDVALGTAADSAPPAGVRIAEAWVVLGDIRFVQSAVCNGGSEQQADIPGPTAVELIGRREVLDFMVEQGRYCRVRVPLDRADEDLGGIPSELVDAAIVVRGTNAAGTPFTIRSRQTREADVRSRTEPFSLQQADAGLILAFDVARWLRDVDLEGAEVQDGGVILIDDDHERPALERFEENVESAMELFRDHDRDRELDDTEAAMPLASGG